MDELIDRMTEQLGLDPSTAQGVAGQAMSMIKKNVDTSTYSKLVAAIPGLESIIMAVETQAPEDRGGGFLGKLASMAGGMLGGSAGNALEMGAALSQKGLPTDKLGEFMTMLMGFIEAKAGSQVLEQVYAKFPMLKSLLDGEQQRI